jgi:hypothetical protein
LQIVELALHGLLTFRVIVDVLPALPARELTMAAKPILSLSAIASRSSGPFAIQNRSPALSVREPGAVVVTPCMDSCSAGTVFQALFAAYIAMQRRTRALPE